METRASSKAPFPDVFTLPGVVDRYLFGPAQAWFGPDPQRVRSTLAVGPEELRWYLGTYFPRSFVEGRVAISRRLDHPAWRTAILGKTTIRILDLGSGTGGFAAGLAWGLRDLGFDGTIDITAVEGNADALNFQMQMWSSLALQHIRVRPCHVVLPASDWEPPLRRLGNGFDLVTASKFLIEMYPGPTDRAVPDAAAVVFGFLDLAERVLNRPGLAIVNEVNVKFYPWRETPGWYSYQSQFLNHVSRLHAGKPGRELGIVLPAPCALFHAECQSPRDCYQHLTHAIRHTQAFGDVAKSILRVWATRDLADQFLEEIRPEVPFRIATFPTRQKICAKGRCFDITAPSFPCQEGFILGQEETS